jgi:hypothetical protein
MAHSSIPHCPSLSRVTVSKKSEMETLICQASGLAQAIIEQNLIEYEPTNPNHKVLWLLCDLAVRVEGLLTDIGT